MRCTGFSVRRPVFPAAERKRGVLTSFPIGKIVPRPYRKLRSITPPLPRLIVPHNYLPVPAMVADPGEAAALRFIDFFTANIRNPNTRAAYAVAVRGFFAWLETRGVRELGAIRTHHVSAYVEVLTPQLQGADGQAAPGGDPHAVRLADRRPGRRPEPGRRRCAGPSTSSKKARRRCSTATRRRQLLDSIDVVDRSSACATAALIASLIYTLRPDLGRAAHERRGLLSAGQALVGAAARERRQAARDAGAPSARELSSTPTSRAAGIGADKTSPLFRTLGGRGRKQLPASA